MHTPSTRPARAYMLGMDTPPPKTPKAPWSFLFKRTPVALLGALLFLAPAVAVIPSAMIAIHGRMGMATPLSGQAFDPQGTLLVLADPGGGVITRLIHVRRLEREGVPVAVHGVCASACTAYLGLPDMCSARDALWMFHPIQQTREHWLPGLLHTLTGGADPLKERLTNIFNARYHPTFATWVRGLEASMSDQEEYWLTGAEIIDAGWASDCATPLLPGAMDMARTRARILSRGFVPDAPLPQAPWLAHTP